MLLLGHRKSPQQGALFLRATKMLFIRLYEAASVDELFLKPYCSCVKILLLLI